MLFLKRLIDLTLSMVGLLALAPLLVLIGAGVWFTSGSPILFRQRRVGWQGEDFVLYKFRTMTVLQGAENGLFQAGSQARVTRLGRWLRHTKLDELPQLVNVVKGDMSLVGPRPEVRHWVDDFAEQWAVVHTVRPGITDPASLRFRGEEDLLAQASDPEKLYREEILPQKLALYQEYVRQWTVGQDIRILWATVRLLLFGS